MHSFMCCPNRWFFGGIKNVEAEKLLMQPFNSLGSFMVRYSETTPGNYSLSIRDREKVRHYHILSLEDGTLSITRQVMFETGGTSLSAGRWALCQSQAALSDIRPQMTGLPMKNGRLTDTKFNWCTDCGAVWGGVGGAVEQLFSCCEGVPFWVLPK